MSLLVDLTYRSVFTGLSTGHMRPARDYWGLIGIAPGQTKAIGEQMRNLNEVFLYEMRGGASTNRDAFASTIGDLS